MLTCFRFFHMLRDLRLYNVSTAGKNEKESCNQKNTVFWHHIFLGVLEAWLDHILRALLPHIGRQYIIRKIRPGGIGVLAVADKYRNQLQFRNHKNELSSVAKGKVRIISS